MSLRQDDDHFKEFALALEREIAKYGDQSDRHNVQKRQIETLMALEEEFRAVLTTHRWGEAVYRDFIEYIRREKRNLLAARPYFRERQEVFTAEIGVALKAKDAKALFKYRLNYQFVQWALASRKWYPRSRARLLGSAIQKARTEIIETNMPLAISRARIFWSRTPRSHLSYMDLVQISCEGLMSGLDKYVPADEVIPRQFRGVAIGRITGNFIDDYSATLLHFFPADKRRLYRANKEVSRCPDGVDYERVAAAVNADMDGEARASASEIAGLLAAASCVSADSSSTGDPDAPEPIDRFAAPAGSRPDVQAEEREAVGAVSEAIQRLSVFERKLLRLKGVKFAPGDSLYKEHGC